jgi:YggT family protein
MSTSILSLVLQGLAAFFSIYYILLLARILLSWFPTVDWMSPPFSIISQLTDPYLNLFRRVIPPMGGLDLSPFLAFFVLYVVQQFLNIAISQIGVPGVF